MGFTVELAATLEASNDRLLRSRVLFAGRQNVIHFEAHLEAGEKARNILLSSRLPAAEHVTAGSFLVIATDRPGIRARVGQYGTTKLCRPNGLLLAPPNAASDPNGPGAPLFSQVQGGVTLPAFLATGAWVNHGAGSGASYRQLKIQGGIDAQPSPTASLVGFTKSRWADSYAAVGDAEAEMKYVFDRYNAINLGAANDGKVFVIWFYHLLSGDGGLGAGASPSFRASSYPYQGTSPVGEAAPPSGTTSDVQMVRNGAPGPAPFNVEARADLSSQLRKTYAGFAGRAIWYPLIARKSDFMRSDTGLSDTESVVDWSKITVMTLLWTCVIPTLLPAGIGGIYFGDPPESEINGPTVLELRALPWGKSCVLSLDGAAGGPANVEGYVVIG